MCYSNAKYIANFYNVKINVKFWKTVHLKEGKD